MSRTDTIIKAAVVFLALAIIGALYLELSKTKKKAELNERDTSEPAARTLPVAEPVPETGVETSSAPAEETAVQTSSAPAEETNAYPSSLAAEGPLQTADTGALFSDLLTELLAARFNEEPGEAFKGGDWRTDLSENYNHNYDARSFYKSGPSDEIRLYSYTPPSLFEYRELIMAGYVRLCGHPNQDKAAGFLEANGFAVSVPDENIIGFGAAYRQGVLKIEKDALSGLVYYESYKNKRCLKVTMSHKDTLKYARRPDISREAFFPSKAPGGLLTELESYGIASLVGTAWEEIKSASQGGAAPGPEKLISAYNSAKTDGLEAEKKPAFTLFRDYLISYIFDSLNAETRQAFRKTLRDAPPQTLKLLEEAKIPYGYDRLRGAYYSPAAFSIRLYDEYPDSYWGQSVFLKHLSEGFMESPFVSKLLSEKVAQKGEAFLSRHSTSPFTTDVMFLIARAYETSYSVGQSLESYSNYICNNTDCVKLLQKSEDHRRSAIQMYKEILNRPDRERYEEFLSYTLPRLETKTKTYCRFYLNIYD